MKIKAGGKFCFDLVISPRFLGFKIVSFVVISRDNFFFTWIPLVICSVLDSANSR